MLYKLGRFLQFVGLFILPIAMMGEVAGPLTLRQMLMWVGAGIGVFYLGWTLQKSRKE